MERLILPTQGQKEIQVLLLVFYSCCIRVKECVYVIKAFVEGLHTASALHTLPCLGLQQPSWIILQMRSDSESLNDLPRSQQVVWGETESHSSKK